eukprot:5398169-Alexandrium_andersonii.AAC.1
MQTSTARAGMQRIGCKSRDRPFEDIHETQELTKEMLGSRDNPKFKAKAGEIKFLVYFVVDMLEHYQQCLPQPQGKALLEAGGCLARTLDIIKDGGDLMDPAQIQETWCLKHSRIGGCVCVRACVRAYAGAAAAGAGAA